MQFLLKFQRLSILPINYVNMATSSRSATLRTWSLKMTAPSIGFRYLLFLNFLSIAFICGYVAVPVLLAMAKSSSRPSRIRHLSGEAHTAQQTAARPRRLRAGGARQSAQESRQQVGFHHNAS